MKGLRGSSTGRTLAILLGVLLLATGVGWQFGMAWGLILTGAIVLVLALWRM